ncbi:hypothetical protein [Auraticoccus cholistanensis]|uniref:hypothetical protein n=1 Tax=Auraticoccus cholistanensis TaxID=2656650 RepID=UPI0018D27314|nr:hypothetical protein [Auraticoccus cholistanensis]
MTALPPPPGASRARPEVARAAEQALLPLRPLTLGEILDAGFWVVVRNARAMVGLPLGVAVLQGLFVLTLLWLWRLLGQHTSQLVAGVVVVLVALLGLLAGGVLLVWLTAVLSRFSLRTVLGPGFAPTTTSIGWRQNLRLLGPMTGFAVLATVLLAVVSWLSSFVSVLALPLTVTGDPVLAAAGSLLALVLMAGVACWGYSYLLLAVPVYALESASAPSWIGRPRRETWMPVAFVRALVLVGGRQVLRALVLTGAVIGMVSAAFWAVVLAALVAVAVYGPVLPVSAADVGALADRPGTWFVAGSLLTVLLGCVLPFAASTQTVFYLDLRMRREGLDVAMRFDCVQVPQPTAAPGMVRP